MFYIHTNISLQAAYYTGFYVMLWLDFLPPFLCYDILHQTQFYYAYVCYAS